MTFEGSVSKMALEAMDFRSQGMPLDLDNHQIHLTGESSTPWASPRSRSIGQIIDTGGQSKHND